ncbi:4-carboxymuconolactone decarboxylase [Azospirillaceae bacterium]
MSYPYGEILSRPGLDPKLRELCVISSLLASGSVQAHLKTHMGGFLNLGGRPKEVIELLFVAIAAIGFPAAINGVAGARGGF